MFQDFFVFGPLPPPRGRGAQSAFFKNRGTSAVVIEISISFHLSRIAQLIWSLTYFRISLNSGNFFFYDFFRKFLTAATRLSISGHNYSCNTDIDFVQPSSDRPSNLLFYVFQDFFFFGPLSTTPGVSKSVFSYSVIFAISPTKNSMNPKIIVPEFFFSYGLTEGTSQDTKIGIKNLHLDF